MSQRPLEGRGFKEHCHISLSLISVLVHSERGSLGPIIHDNHKHQSKNISLDTDIMICALNI